MEDLGYIQDELFPSSVVESRSGQVFHETVYAALIKQSYIESVTSALDTYAQSIIDKHRTDRIRMDLLGEDFGSGTNVIDIDGEVVDVGEDDETPELEVYEVEFEVFTEYDETIIDNEVMLAAAQGYLEREPEASVRLIMEVVYAFFENAAIQYAKSYPVGKVEPHAVQLVLNGVLTLIRIAQRKCINDDIYEEVESDYEEVGLTIEQPEIQFDLEVERWRPILAKIRE
jgi:hypothetical protein